MMVFDPARIPVKLIEAYRQGRCALLVGAGASKGAGLPLWDEFLAQLVKKAKAHHLIGDDKALEYDRLIADPGKYLMAASALKVDLGSSFDDAVREIFVDSKPQPTDLHRAIVGLDKLKFVITTNYDILLEKAYRTAGHDDVTALLFNEGGELQSRLHRGEFFILKAHGDGQRPGNGLILTERDYREILYRQRAYQALLTTMFTMFSVVFIGASMVDPETKLLLNYIADAFDNGSGPKHYAVMAKEDITTIEQDRWFKDLNVQLIPVSKANSYAELTEFTLAMGK